MKFADLLEIIGEESVFSSSLLLAGRRDSNDVRRQLSRWVKDGKLVQLRRSFYMLPDLYRKKAAHPFLLATRMKAASYVSLQSALAYYGLIPEYVPVVTSVTTGRPETLNTPVGTFAFGHIKGGFFSGYSSLSLPNGQSAFVALPEKALLDLIYLTPDGDNPDYLRGLRLQNLDRLDMVRLKTFAKGRAKLERAAEQIAGLFNEEEHVEL